MANSRVKHEQCVATEQILSKDLVEERQEEVEALMFLCVAYCEGAKDYVSRELLEHILEDTEEHIDWIETQLELIGKVGVQNYLQSQMDEEAKS